MRDFDLERLKAQGTAPEPYTLYNREQNVDKVILKSETLRDFEYFRSMYPARVKGLQLLVEEACDEMDYRGSPMYDEFPDRVMVEQLCRKVGVEVAKKTSENQMGKEATSEPKEEVEIYKATEAPVKCDGMPRMPYGPEYILQSVSPDIGNYRTWEMEDKQAHPDQVQTEQVQIKRTQTERIQEVDEMRRPWGPPPPPWNPPPPPHRPWNPPPRPCGPPPPPRPWGPPHPHNDRFDADDIVRLLLFNEIQKRRCNGRNCR